MEKPTTVPTFYVARCRFGNVTGLGRSAGNVECTHVGRPLPAAAAVPVTDFLEPFTRLSRIIYALLRTAVIIDFHCCRRRVCAWQRATSAVSNNAISRAHGGGDLVHTGIDV